MRALGTAGFNPAAQNQADSAARSRYLSAQRALVR